MKYSVNWKDVALVDYGDVVSFLMTTDCPWSFIDKLEQETKYTESLLQDFPYIGAPIFTDIHKINVLEGYSIIYKVDEVNQSIFILCFWDSRKTKGDCYNG